MANGIAVPGGHSGVGVGNDEFSWGIDFFTGNKIHFVSFGDRGMRSKFEAEKVIGIAANLDKGMIAISVDGDWSYEHGNGVQFEDESIKSGVYPCITAKLVEMECKFGPDFKYAPPHTSLWGKWPKFDDLTWFGMTEEARAATMALGYTQNTWMGSGNPIESKRWDELSNEDRAAANILGYDADIWAQLTKLWARDNDDDSYSSGDSNYYDHSSLEGTLWINLPSDARRAAETLGYTPTTWNDEAEGPLDDKSWDELTLEQQRAAIVLGYHKESWNEGSDSDSSGSSSSSSDGSGFQNFDHLSWQELPRNAREAAGKLGHNADSWDQDIKGPWDERRWEELPLEQQFAASVLGYDEFKWNSDIDIAHNLASILLGGSRQS